MLKIKKIRIKNANKWTMLTKSKFQEIIFSDECIFNAKISNRTQKIRRASKTRYEEKNTIKTKKQGGTKIMVWACISYEGPRKLIIVDGNMDKFKYV